MPARARPSEATRFLNVDLDLYSKSDLAPLVQALGSRVFILYIGRMGRRYCAHLELRRMVLTPDSTIRAFCRLIRGLPAAERGRWHAASRRSFSIGVQAGTHPHSTDFLVKPETIAQVAELDAEIVLTVYSPEQ